MIQFLAQVFLMGLPSTSGLIAPLDDQIGQYPARAKLSDLTFIVGRWQADWDGGLGEEHWSSASGDSMVGTFRFVKDGERQFYEFIEICLTLLSCALLLQGNGSTHAQT